MKQLSKAIELLGTAVVLVLLAGIALVLLKANRTNDIVEAIRDAADWLATPFNDMFELDSRRTHDRRQLGGGGARLLRGLARPGPRQPARVSESGRNAIAHAMLIARPVAAVRGE